MKSIIKKEQVDSAQNRRPEKWRRPTSTNKRPRANRDSHVYSADEIGLTGKLTKSLCCSLPYSLCFHTNKNKIGKEENKKGENASAELTTFLLFPFDEREERVGDANRY